MNILLTVVGIMVLFVLLAWIAFVTRNPLVITVDPNDYESRAINSFTLSFATIFSIFIGVIVGWLFNSLIFGALFYLAAVFFVIPKYTLIPLLKFMLFSWDKISAYTLTLDKKIHDDKV